jgi:hypothetical protein
MTYETFLAKLRETPRDWEIVSPWVAGCGSVDPIRRDGGCECPLQAVIPAWETDTAPEPEWWGDVRQAADGHCLPGIEKYWSLKPELESVRRDLLAACGLEDREAEIW